MDQNWNNGANGNSMPAPNMGMDPNAVPNNGMNQGQQMNSSTMSQQQAPQMMPQASQGPQMMPPNMNMGGSAPVLNQPGVAVAQAPAAPKTKNTLIETLILVAVCLIAAGAIVAAVIFFMRYNELSENYDADLNTQIAAARLEEQEAAQKRLNEKLKEPYQEFTGPADYGSISFEYPKTWSVYVDKVGSGDFMAYFQPNQVPPVSDGNSRYALRFAIYNRQYDVVAKPYIKDVDNGKLKSQNFTADNNAISGIRFEGEISKNLHGTFVIFKVNDKTAVLQTDTDLLMEDFERILTTLRRNTN